MKKIIFLSIILFFLIFTIKAPTCTIIAAGKKATKDGSIIVSHTDCGADSRLRIVQGRYFKKGALANVYYGIQEVKRPLDDYGEIIGKIPQVKQTYSYFHSAYPHINKHQLAIAESTMSQRPELEVDNKTGKQIMTIEQAMIFALQRCKKAEQAVQLITSLVDKYGFLPSCARGSEALAIGDTEEVWILEVFSVGPEWTPECGEPGAIWAAQRLPDDHATMIPNWSIIKKINPKDKDNFLVSKNYKSFAIEKGWYKPETGDPFIWQDVYSPIPREWATSRFWLFYSKFAQNLTNWPDRYLKNNMLKGYDSYHQFVEPLSIYPFSAKPEKKISVKDVVKFQRETFPSTIYDKTADIDWIIPDGKGGYKKSPLTTPFPTKPMRELLDITRRRNVSKTGYGMIAQLRGWLPDPIGGVYWFYVDNTHTSIHVPIYIGTQKIADSYKTYNPDEYSENSARWIIDFVDNLLYLRWQDAIQDLYRLRDPLQNRFFEEQNKIDTKAKKLYDKNPQKAKKILTEYTLKNMEKVVNTYKKIRDILITKYTNNKQGS